MEGSDTMATATRLYKPMNKRFELTTYEDPYPGMSDSDKVNVRCTRCGGTGEFGPKVVFSGICFLCEGARVTPVTVGTLRKKERERVMFAEHRDEINAFHEELSRLNEIARLAEEFEQDWTEAQAEQDRRESLTQGFLGEIGEKVTNIPVTIRYAQYNAGSWNRSATMFIIATTESGQAIKISGSSESLFSLERGDEATILQAKVKGQGEYNGQQQTILSHVKVAVKELVDA